MGAVGTVVGAVHHCAAATGDSLVLSIMEGFLMGITPKDIADQRAMLERGEAISKANQQRAERERLRDTFAAAALTGLLARHGHAKQDSDDGLCSNPAAWWAYRYADAMLRKRERVTEPPPKETQAEVSNTIHDAAPAAKAQLSSGDHASSGGGSDRNDKPAPRTATGTGDIPCSRTRDIASYAVYLNGEYDSSYGPDAIDEAFEIAQECSGDVVPLYRSPTLTDEELKAIRRAAAVADEMHDARMKAALGGLLERLG